jgi:hypothetical protein
MSERVKAGFPATNSGAIYRCVPLAEEPDVRAENLAAACALSFTARAKPATSRRSVVAARELAFAAT